MADAAETERSFGEIIFQFDLDHHSIPLQKFLDTAQAAQTIIDGFNEQLFEKKLKYELRVQAPAAGGLIEALQLVVFVSGAVWALLGTDIGKALVRGLTGNDPAFWAEKLGKNIRKTVTRGRDDKQPPLGFQLKTEDELQKSSNTNKPFLTSLPNFIVFFSF